MEDVNRHTPYSLTSKLHRGSSRTLESSALHFLLEAGLTGLLTASQSSSMVGIENRWASTLRSIALRAGGVLERDR